MLTSIFYCRFATKIETLKPTPRMWGTFLRNLLYLSKIKRFYCGPCIGEYIPVRWIFSSNKVSFLKFRKFDIKHKKASVWFVFGNIFLQRIKLGKLSIIIAVDCTFFCKTFIKTYLTDVLYHILSDFPNFQEDILCVSKVILCEYRLQLNVWSIWIMTLRLNWILKDHKDG